MSNERPCDNCRQLKVEHRGTHYFCDIDHLPIVFQEMYYYYHGDRVIPKYSPMENLKYLEWEYEQSIL